MGETVVAAEQRWAKASLDLDAARQEEQELRERLGTAYVSGADTVALQAALRAQQEKVELLGAALPAFAEAVNRARFESEQRRKVPLREQLAAVVAERRKTAEEAQLLMQDLTAAVAKLAHLGTQTTGLAKQLGLPDADRAGNHHTLPMWLCASIYPVSPGGAAEWPAGGAHPDYAARGILEIEEEALSRGGAT